MTWEIVLRGNEGETKVNKCLAVRCKHNEHQNCMLDAITITSDNKCKQFTHKEGDSAGSTLTPGKSKVQLDTDEFSYQEYDEA